ncbi:signal peptidase I [Ichthyenterobacterium sp. W332]|uniref:Signal peptidase I n=1 Tax=Microcosmobacter mediterraneus TaxID=3075607 RepID=A0ABU2YGC7_9FLAO|nr:signal peptidase I [Ichthyenterobacterium sp. W332]MDT0557206.1 signal peptidase I [Ichthyenterobacterium sp. W332]
MNWTQWLIFFLIIQVIHGLGTWKLYVKAGRKPWEAFVPVYNAYILMKIINRPWWWTILLFLPIVNLIMLPAVWVETARSFGKNSLVDTLLAVITFGFYSYYISYATNAEYVKERDLNPVTSAGEWISSILFAIVAATIVHTYFFQPYVIPSSSLEKSLLIGDFLIVSKMHYGARTPMTTVAAPMVHDTIPLLKKKSYLFSDEHDKRETSWKNKLQLPYFRLPGWDNIDRNEIVVFNQPADTLLDMNNFHPDRNYYKPIDKKTNLVKRCVGISGDTLEVKGGYVYINGEKNVLPDRAELLFQSDVKSINYLTDDFIRSLNCTEYYRYYKIERSKIDKYLSDNFPLSAIEGDNINAQIMLVFPTHKNIARSVIARYGLKTTNQYTLNITDNAFNKLSNDSNIKSITKLTRIKGEREDAIFPQDPSINWNTDFFGPVYIPEAGKTIELTLDNLPIYNRLITEYEGNSVVTRGNQIIINEEPTTSYTFKQDYYWMMGDNRHNSIDARRWGFVPYNHVVGKPVFIWMSIDNFNDGFKNWRPRWSRIFTTVHGSGERVSYLIPFLVLLVGWNIFSRIRKRKKAK